MTNAALIAKLEQAQEGSRELDAHICCAMSTEDGPFFNPFLGEDGSWYVQAGIGGWQMKHGDFPHYTTNLQAAVDLVPEGYGAISLSITEQTYHPENKCRVTWGHPYFAVFGATPALALCVAILRALETEAAAQGENHE